MSGVCVCECGWQEWKQRDKARDCRTGIIQARKENGPAHVTVKEMGKGQMRDLFGREFDDC